MSIFDAKDCDSILSLVQRPYVYQQVSKALAQTLRVIEQKDANAHLKCDRYLGTLRLMVSRTDYPAEAFKILNALLQRIPKTQMSSTLVEGYVSSIIEIDKIAKLFTENTYNLTDQFVKKYPGHLSLQDLSTMVSGFEKLFRASDDFGDTTCVFGALRHALHLAPKGQGLIVFQNFITMLTQPSITDYNLTVGFEVEFFAGDDDLGAEYREVCLGPYSEVQDAMAALTIAQRLTCLDVKNSISTLHINFGLTAEQYQIFNQNKASIDGVMAGLAIFSNSPARFHRIRWIQDSYEHNDMLFADVHGMRIEYKGFDVSRGTDLATIRLAILAMRAMLKEPKIINHLARNFAQIHEYFGSPDFSDLSEAFFGTVSAKGRVYGCLTDARPAVRNMVARTLVGKAILDIKERPPEKIFRHNAWRLDDGDWQPVTRVTIFKPSSVLKNAVDTSKLSSDERAAQHPFARIAAKAPEPQ